jgi:hypothetical protein
MPPYRAAVLAKAEKADIHDYLNSIPEPPPLKDNPLLNQKIRRATRIFGAVCREY